MIQKVRGMQDIFTMKEYDRIVELISVSLINQGFSHIKLPTIEYVQLFEKTLGNETDVVSKEMFLVSSIRTDEGDEKSKSMCLRPEATAQIMRAYLENGVQDAPWKVFTVGSCFRYERPQKGRYREFSQISIEMLNAHSVYYDIELMINLCRLFDELGLKNLYRIHINYIGSYLEREEYNKVLKEYISNNLTEKISLEEYQKLLKSPLKLFDSKNPICRQYAQKAPLINNYFQEQSCLEWEKIKKLLSQYGIDFIYDPMVVRGLDYYNGVVFEFKGLSEELGAQNVFCGGGRYDRLSLLLHSKKEIPAMGVGIGIERLLLALSSLEKKEQKKESLYYVIVESQNEHEYALDCVLELQKHFIKIIINHDVYGIKNGFKKANQLGATHVLIIGENERLRNILTLKNLETGEQVNNKKEDIMKIISGQLSS